jgi:hypothetical protein
MGIKKQSGLMLDMLGMMAAMGDTSEMGYNKPERINILTPEERAKLKLRMEKQKINKLKEKGVIEFFYGENSVFARNQKNADRKAKNLGYI